MRRTERLPVELTVTWTRAGRAIACSAVDVSAHGLFVRTEEIVERDTLMHLRVELPARVVEMFVTARFVGQSERGQGIGAEIFLIDDVSNRHWLAHYDALCSAESRSRKLSAMGA